MSEHEDDKELIKEARELIQKANYPADLNRYFNLLRTHGFEMNVAGTYADRSERWEFSKNSGQTEMMVTIIFSRNSRALSWNGTFGLASGESKGAAGDSVEQLEFQLNPRT